MESLRNSADFKELLSRFDAEGARYLIVGGFAPAHYCRPRYTRDLDIGVDSRDDNPERIFRALASFGAPLDGISPNDFRDADTVPGRVRSTSLRPTSGVGYRVRSR